MDFRFGRPGAAVFNGWALAELGDGVICLRKGLADWVATGCVT
jgi:hypothetical protein